MSKVGVSRGRLFCAWLLMFALAALVSFAVAWASRVAMAFLLSPVIDGAITQGIDRFSWALFALGMVLALLSVVLGGKRRASEETAIQDGGAP